MCFSPRLYDDERIWLLADFDHANMATTQMAVMLMQAGMYSSHMMYAG